MTPRRALLAASVVAAVLFAWVGRGLTYYGDEWEWLLATVDVRPEIFLESYNGHLTVPTIALFSAIPAIFGMDEYAALRIAAIPAHLACVWLALASPPEGRRGGGAVAAMLLLFLGAATDVLPVTAWNSAILVAVAAGLSALLMLEPQTLRGDIAAAVLLGVALASQGAATAFLCCALVEVAFSPDRRRRLLVMAAPLVLYLGWWAQYGEANTAAAGLGDRVLFFVHLAASALAGLLGVQLTSPRVQDLPGAVTLANIAAIAAALAVVWVRRVACAAIPAAAGPCGGDRRAVGDHHRGPDGRHGSVQHSLHLRGRGARPPGRRRADARHRARARGGRAVAAAAVVISLLGCAWLRPAVRSAGRTRGS